MSKLLGETNDWRELDIDDRIVVEAIAIFAYGGDMDAAYADILAQPAPVEVTRQPDTTLVRLSAIKRLL
jgi:hypothetical protein